MAGTALHNRAPAGVVAVSTLLMPVASQAPGDPESQCSPWLDQGAWKSTGERVQWGLFASYQHGNIV